VAKTANLLHDGLAVEPGTTVGMLLPLHWQTVCILLGCWAAGASVVIGSASQVEVAFAEEPELPAALAGGASDVLGLSLRPLAGPLDEVPPGVIDYAAEVPAYGDRFVSPVLEPDAPALTLPEGSWTVGGLTAETERAVAGWQLGPGDRVLSTLPYDTPHGLLAGLLAPLAAGGGVVLCRNPDRAVLPRRLDVERVTAVAGLAAPGSGVRILTP
jgi:uncharacterized protein (TIGR03089 family)